jgi:hypothetical protein
VTRLISDAPDVEEPAGGFMGLSQVAVLASRSQSGLTPATCSFCGVPSPACGALFAGQGGALICEQCVRRGASGLGAPPERPSLEELAARHEPAGPLPDDEDAARAEIEHAFANFNERTPDGRGLVNIEHGHDLAQYADQVQARYGAIAAQTEMMVEHMKFLGATEAVVWLTTVRNGRPSPPAYRREGRAMLVGDAWKVSYETIREIWALVGVHPPPGSDPPSPPQ